MVLRPKPPNRASMVLRPNHQTSRDVSLPDFDCPSRQVIRAPRSASTLAILSQSTRSLHMFLRPSMSQVSATTACHPVIWSLDPSLMTALSPALSYSARHVHVRPSPPWSIGTARHHVRPFTTATGTRHGKSPLGLYLAVSFRIRSST